MLKFIFSFFIFAVTLSSKAQDLGVKAKPTIAPYVDFLKKQRKKPVDYVIDLFDKHDIVILVEGYHYETTQFEFFKNLLRDPRLTSKVGYFFTEYMESNQYDDLQAFLKNPKFDAQGRVGLLRGFGWWPAWYYRALYDFLKDYHEIYQQTPLKKRLHWYPTDMMWKWDWFNYNSEKEFVRAKKDFQNMLHNVVTGNRDRSMAKFIKRKINEIESDKNEPRKKYLILMNTLHGYGLVKDQEGQYYESVGTYLHRAYPGRVANVLLNAVNFRGEHKDKNPVKLGIRYSLIADGKWDASFEVNGNRPVGFDFKNNAFGKDFCDYRGKAGVRKNLYHLKYEDVFTGLVFLKPLEEHMVDLYTPELFKGPLKTEALKRARLWSDDYLKTYSEFLESYTEQKYGLQRLIDQEVVNQKLKWLE